jgi:hypothetical protein
MAGTLVANQVFTTGVLDREAEREHGTTEARKRRIRAVDILERLSFNI